MDAGRGICPSSLRDLVSRTLAKFPPPPARPSYFPQHLQRDLKVPWLDEIPRARRRRRRRRGRRRARGRRRRGRAHNGTFTLRRPHSGKAACQEGWIGATRRSVAVTQERRRVRRLFHSRVLHTPPPHHIVQPHNDTPNPLPPSLPSLTCHHLSTCASSSPALLPHTSFCSLPPHFPHSSCLAHYPRTPTLTLYPSNMNKPEATHVVQHYFAFAGKCRRLSHVVRRANSSRTGARAAMGLPSFPRSGVIN